MTLADIIEEPLKPTFFATPSAFRAWLEEHHHTTQELWVGFYKRSSGKPSITWPEAVDEVLCFGWIDGVRKGIDDISYTIRFTPRKPRSTWSPVNITRVKELTAQGLMRPAGLKAFEQRAEERSEIYSYEREKARLDDAFEQQFRANTKAWDFFQTQPAWYRKTASWWVISAKREETRRKRLATLIDDSEHGRTIAPLTRRSRQE
ncbi:MAG: YdeI/OmpD-associated family protein [Ktedonobacteraceae bacterium]